MIVTPAGAATATTTAAASDSSRAALNYDAFLRLLVAEMKNQDPTEPTDPTQSLSQLASFSGVEQGIKTNAKLDSLMAMTQVGQAGAIVGKTLTSADGGVSGVVKSVEVNSDGSIAVLESGARVVLGAGIRIS